MITTTHVNDVMTMIDGPAGQLEMIVNEATKESNIWGIVCHPHPLFGGTMHNKVVTTLAKMFQGMGANTVRFNYRGVMKSEGAFANGEGELEDLLAVVKWVRELSPRQEIWLAGFSFGGYISVKAAPLVDAKKLVTIAPPVENFPMADLAPVTCRWVLAQGEKDDVVSSSAVLAWAESRDPKPVILRFPEAGHFFHGALTELRTRVAEELVK